MVMTKSLAKQMAQLSKAGTRRTKKQDKQRIDNFFGPNPAALDKVVTMIHSAGLGKCVAYDIVVLAKRGKWRLRQHHPSPLHAS